MQAVERAHAELQAEIQELRWLNRDLFEDETECCFDLDDFEEFADNEETTLET